eukprot:scaffold736_cov254-Pinguiococcus_pyrenoidosus.AAC.38
MKQWLADVISARAARHVTRLPACLTTAAPPDCLAVVRDLASQNSCSHDECMAACMSSSKTCVTASATAWLERGRQAAQVVNHHDARMAWGATQDCSADCVVSVGV